ncbi:MAG: zinc-ribbon domain containing protein [Carboxydocellales bacterium]
MFTDKSLTCKDCGESFDFTASEQEFYAEKGFTNEPGRCPQCRSARKAERSGGGRGGYGQQRQTYPATCAQCGTATQVPFQPSGDRPVYCRDCYSAQRSTKSYSRY